MELKLVTIECCAQCRFCKEYIDKNIPNRTIVVCRNKRQILNFEGQGGYKGFPDWCPLDSQFNEVQASIHAAQVASSEAPNKEFIISAIEWAPANLTGHGGKEVDGQWYYNWDQAMAAAEALGDGWRLPTAEELAALCDLGSTWVKKGPEGVPGRWFGGNHATDHEGSLFFPASGYRNRTDGSLSTVGSSGNYWSSSPASAGSQNAGYLSFYHGGVYPLNYSHRAFGFPVRCVREIKTSSK